MVIKRITQNNNHTEPPIDESWWQSVLAEDEDRHSNHSPKEARANSKFNHRSSTLPHEDDYHLLDWGRAIELYEQDEVVSMVVKGFNRGGVLVSGFGLQGFVPISHLVKMPAGKGEADQEQFLASYLGQDLRLKIIECDQERGRVVFSERAALAEAGSRNLLLQRLRNGGVRREQRYHERNRRSRVEESPRPTGLTDPRSPRTEGRRSWRRGEGARTLSSPLRASRPAGPSRPVT